MTTLRSRERAIFEATIGMCRSYGDNLFHCHGEQADRQFNAIIAKIDAALAADQSEPEPVKQSRPAEGEKCGCYKCNPDLHGLKMFVCPICGNKRCPRATFHGNECTNSNASGQPGTLWENSPPFDKPTPATGPTQAEPTNTYQRLIKGCLKVDVYDVLRAFNVTDPALQHSIKKLLLAGERGHKDRATDLREAIESIKRAN